MKWILFCVLAIPALAQTPIDDLLSQLEMESFERAGERDFSFDYQKGPDGSLRAIAGFLTEPGEFEANATGFLEQYGALFGFEANPFENLEFHKTWDREADLLPYLTFSQRFENLLVYNAILSVHGDQQGAVFDIYSSLKPMQSLMEEPPDLHPSLGEEALHQILVDAGRNPVSHVHTTLEPEFEQQPLEMELSTPKLFLYYQDRIKTWHLVYVMQYGSLDNYAEYVIDAHNGAILEMTPLTYSLGNKSGSGTDSLGRKQNLNVWQFNYLLAPLPQPTFTAKGANEAPGFFNKYVRTSTQGIPNDHHISVDASKSDQGVHYSVATQGGAFTFVSSPSSNLDRLSPTPVSKAAVDNMVGLRKSSDYFAQTFGWKGIDNKGASVMSFARYGHPRNAGFNARLGLMITGPGGVHKGKTIKHLGAALDILAHEFTHGVTEYRTPKGLPYRNETGAINEHISDLFGALIQAKYDRLNWTMGEDANFTIRNFEDPHRHQHPKTLGGQFYFAPVENPSNTNDYGGVHHLSSLPNRTLYLMATGGTFNGKAFPAFDSNPTKALEKIAYLYFHAMPAMTPDIDFLGLYRLLKNTMFKVFSSDPNAIQYLLSLNGAWGSIGMKGGQYLPGTLGDSEPNDTYFQASVQGANLMNIQTYGALSHNMPIYGLDTDVFVFENTQGNAPLVIDLNMDNPQTQFALHLKKHTGTSSQTLALKDFRNIGGGWQAVIPKGHFSIEIEQLNHETSTYSLHMKFSKYSSFYGNNQGILMNIHKYLSRVKISKGKVQGKKSLLYVDNLAVPMRMGFVSQTDPRTRKDTWLRGKMRIIFDSVKNPGNPITYEFTPLSGQHIRLPKTGYYTYEIEVATAVFSQQETEVLFGIVSGGAPSPFP